MLCLTQLEPKLISEVGFVAAFEPAQSIAVRVPEF